MRKRRGAVRRLAVNLGLLAAMWVLDRMGLLPRLYPEMADGVPTWHGISAPAGALLVLATAAVGLALLWRMAATSGDGVPQGYPTKD